MTVTTFLEITDLENNQAAPEVTVNEAHDILEAAIAGLLVHNMASDADYSLEVTGTLPYEWHYSRIEVTDTGVVLTTGRNIIVPDKIKRYVLYNNTAQIITIKTAAGTGIAVGIGMTAQVFCDGVNVTRETADI